MAGTHKQSLRRTPGTTWMFGRERQPPETDRGGVRERDGGAGGREGLLLLASGEGGGRGVGGGILLKRH